MTTAPHPRAAKTGEDFVSVGAIGFFRAPNGPVGTPKRSTLQGLQGPVKVLDDIAGLVLNA
jgi:hypothetical protein